METVAIDCPSPRSIAGRMNRLKRRGLTPEGRERLRRAALNNKPWRFATGPRTAAGKAKVALNGKVRQTGERSVREIRGDLADIRDLLTSMQECQQSAKIAFCSPAESDG